nr:MAG TPA: hypothetical protein [Caudoviricetes sp.]DAR10375.1 MAG TPA: hypothetical protein [Caudoviricetes sp.]
MQFYRMQRQTYILHYFTTRYIVNLIISYKNRLYHYHIF